MAKNLNTIPIIKKHNYKSWTGISLGPDFARSINFTCKCLLTVVKKYTAHFILFHLVCPNWSTPEDACLGLGLPRTHWGKQDASPSLSLICFSLDDFPTKQKNNNEGPSILIGQAFIFRYSTVLPPWDANVAPLFNTCYQCVSQQHQIIHYFIHQCGQDRTPVHTLYVHRSLCCPVFPLLPRVCS